MFFLNFDFMDFLGFVNCIVHHTKMGAPRTLWPLPEGMKYGLYWGGCGYPVVELSVATA